MAGTEPFIRKRRPNKNVQADRCPAGPKKVNQELSILKMILRRAGCWTEEMEEFYEPFREDATDVPRALLPEEQKRWLEIALMRERWWIVYWYSQLAFGTSMGTNEIRSLRVGDVNLMHRIVNVPSAGAKNAYRARTIPITSADTLWAAEQLVARARDLGACSPMHFLFPFRRPPADFDPTRPMTVSGIKKPWEEVRAASGLRWFRPYDTRHTALTRWAESGMDAATLMSLAGHVTPRMMRHYVHISEGVKRAQLGSVPRIGPASVTVPFYMAKSRA